MGMIRLLPDTVINRIKAGEMIERPANVVKELLENAIDAQATRITVSLLRGGLDEITVSDNGIGIVPEDVPLAVKRHTTSKITSSDDLHSLQSLGFRGEALASIAEVSRFSLTTVSVDCDAGTKLEMRTGNPHITTWHGGKGTTISVSSIFHNVPARQKFMKSVATEYAYCCDCVHALCLSHPHIEFILLHNNKEQLRLPCDPQQDDEQILRARAKTLLGAETAGSLLYERNENELGKITALFSPPGVDKANTRYVFTFVNGRWVKNPTLKYGILRGYHSHLLKGRYPIFIARLQIHPSLLDVNVHPMKTEVRFQYPKEIQELIALTIRRKLRTSTWSLPHVPETGSPDKPAPTTEAFESTQDFVPHSSNLHPPKEKGSFGRGMPRQEYLPQDFRPLIPPKDTGSGFGHISPARSPTGQGGQYPHEAPLCSSAESATTAGNKTDTDLAALKFIGCFARCYLLFEDEAQNLVVIDQHAFHERIIFEQIMACPQVLARSQRLLLSETLQLEVEEVETIIARKEDFARLGLDLEVIRENEIKVRGVPALLQGRNYIDLIRDLAKLACADQTAWFGESLLHDVVSTIACRAAIKAGDQLEEERLHKLLTEANKVDFYHNCPHGRRVIRVYTRHQVGEWFDRI